MTVFDGGFLVRCASSSRRMLALPGGSTLAADFTMGGLR